MSGLNLNEPVSLSDVLNSQNIISGDNLILLPGVYTGDWIIPSKFSGTINNPLVIKPLIPNTVIIDGSFTIESDYTEIRDIDFTDSRMDETITSGIYCGKIGFSMIGCDVQNLHNSGVSWFGSGEGMIVECKFRENGYLIDGVGHGHGVYSHNENGGSRLIARNSFGNEVGKYAFQLYSGGENYLKDFTCEDNVIFGDPVHTGGGKGLKNFIYRRNVQFGDYCQQGRYTYDNGWNEDGLIEDNIFVGLYSYSVNSNTDIPWVNLIERNNTVWNVNGYGEPSNRVGYNLEVTPPSWSRFIPFTLSERWAGIRATLNNGVFTSEIINK